VMSVLCPDRDHSDFACAQCDREQRERAGGEAREGQLCGELHGVQTSADTAYVESPRERHVQFKHETPLCIVVVTF
jgi:hypothetical protein